MKLHPSTFDYLKPDDAQLALMERVRRITRMYADDLGTLLPDGPDKTYLLRKLREINMWAMIAISREADGAPRSALRDWPGP